MPLAVRSVLAIFAVIAVLGAASARHVETESAGIVPPPGVDLCGDTVRERAAWSELAALRSRTDESVLDRTGMTATRPHEILICESDGRTLISVHYRGLPGAQPASGAAEFAFENRRLIPKNASARFLMR